MDQLPLDTSIRELRYFGSKTNFNDSPFARMTAGLMKVFLFGCRFLINGDMISFCSRISSNVFVYFILQIDWYPLACCFLKTALDLRGRSNGECIFATLFLDVE